jgi:GNAT superfamily N-acetyltransferase
MQIVIRPARADDLQTAQELVVHSINDLTVRHGFSPMATRRPADFQRFSLDDDPAGLWVAEASGEIKGFAFSWVSDRFWFLAELFVSPGLQGQGIGEALLQRTLDHASGARADNRALVTFPFNKASQGLYIRHGLYPRLPLYFVKASREAVLSRHRGDSLQHTTIDESETDLVRLAQFDAATLGFTRNQHHRFLLRDAAVKGVFLHTLGRCVGYAYVHSGGHIGPLAVTEPDTMREAFTAALALAADSGCSDISAFLPGVNDTAFDLAVAHGMRITFPMVLASAREFGHFSRYLPRNPGFM